MVFTLEPHPDHPPAAVRGVEVQAEVHGRMVSLRYTVSGAVPLLPPPAPSERTDELWTTTCFELFLQPPGDHAYVELNFSPSTRWAAYAFDAHRTGMRNLAVGTPPLIESIEGGVQVTLDLSLLAAGPWRCGITSVIEEVDGTKSFWSLAHPSGEPDFHDRDCFIATLSPPR